MIVMDYYPIIIMLPFFGQIVKIHPFFRIDPSLSGRTPRWIPAAAEITPVPGVFSPGCTKSIT
jgi:hypothetical protein